MVLNKHCRYLHPPLWLLLDWLLWNWTQIFKFAVHWSLLLWLPQSPKQQQCCDEQPVDVTVCTFARHLFFCSLTKITERLWDRFLQVDLPSCCSLANWGYSSCAISPDSVLVSLRNMVRKAFICLRFAASLFSSKSEHSPSITIWSKVHWSSSSRQEIGAKYCCLNSGFDINVARFSFWAFSFACSNWSITWTTRAQTLLGRLAWLNMASQCMFDMPYSKIKGISVWAIQSHWKYFNLLYITSKVTVPQDAHKSLVLQVYLGPFLIGLLLFA